MTRQVPQNIWLSYLTAFDSAMADESAEKVEHLRKNADVLVKYVNGRAKIATDIEDAERALKWEVVGCLSSAVKTKANTAGLYKDLYRASGMVEEVVELPPKKLGFSHRWHPLEPIWAETEHMREALKTMTAFREGFGELAKAGYKSLYRREWEKEFTDFSGNPIQLYEDRNGWELRARVVDRVKSLVSGALVVSPLDITPPVWVFDGREVIRVAQITRNMQSQELVNIKVSGVRGFRANHKDEIWLLFPKYKG